MEDSTVSKGKESLLIPVHAQVINSSVVDRCHRSEIQSVVLAGGDGDNCFILGTVDSYGRLIISRLDTTAAGFHIQYCLGLRYGRKDLGRYLIPPDPLVDGVAFHAVGWCGRQGSQVLVFSMLLLPDPPAKVLMFMVKTFTSATYARCGIHPLWVLFRVQCIAMGILLY